jgi:hypothetical protein
MNTTLFFAIGMVCAIFLPANLREILEIFFHPFGFAYFCLNYFTHATKRFRGFKGYKAEKAGSYLFVAWR